MVHRHADVPAARRKGAPPPEQLDLEEVHLDSLDEVKVAVQDCRRCPLYANATQAVFGEGTAGAEIMLVGEQPGDQEDLAGRPFVGPAGRVLDAALEAAGIDRSRVYVTNAVKHFKFQPRGKRRIHSKPNAGEIRACRFWLGLERELVRPRVIVAMGATAVASLLGRSAAIGSLRGTATTLDDGTPMWVTVHPSYLLRITDRADAAEQRRRFEGDLRAIHDFVKGLPPRH